MIWLVVQDRSQQDDSAVDVCMARGVACVFHAELIMVNQRDQELFLDSPV